MDCRECGQAIEADSRFCRHCGTTQVAVPPPAADTAPPAKAYYPDAERRAAGGGISTGAVLGWSAAAILGVVALASVGGGNNGAPAVVNGSADPLADITDNMTAVDGAVTASPTATPTIASNWDYSTDEDKVRGSTAYFARTVSTNRIEQASPYGGGTSMTLTVRKHPAWGTDVELTISEGQMMCPSYSGCSGTVRFDDRPPQTVRFNGPEDNSSETIFVIGAKGFIAQLKKAKKLTIEKTLYQAGAPQFEFDVAGLDWQH